jgi:acetyl-CoA C-acetyltransferase
VFGNVIHAEVRDIYLARMAALDGGLPVGTPALTVNRLCGRGMQAVVSATQSIMLGGCDVAVAGGAECMSRAPYWLPGMRWGQRMGDGAALDLMMGALSDPFDACYMGMTAENVAADFGGHPAVGDWSGGTDGGGPGSAGSSAGGWPRAVVA